MRKNNLIRDLVIIISILVAIILERTGVLQDLLTSTRELRFLGSLIAGIFFVSIFTVSPAAVVLFEIAASTSPLEVAFFGGLGALIGDLFIFRFIMDSLADDLTWLIKKTGQEKLIYFFRRKTFRWLVPFIGALAVASPLPDEIGLAMMGLSKMNTAAFVPLVFILNFLGILIIGLLAKI